MIYMRGAREAWQQARTQSPINAEIDQAFEQHVKAKRSELVAAEIGINRRHVREDVAHVKLQLCFRQVRRERDALRSQLEALADDNQVLAVDAEDIRSDYISLSHDQALLHERYNLAVKAIEKFEEALKAVSSPCDSEVASAINKLDLLEKQHRLLLEDNELLRCRQYESTCNSIAQLTQGLLEVPQSVKGVERRSDKTLHILTGLGAIALVCFCLKFRG